jgi:sugar phosphate isomerase/epimerase
VAGEQPFPDGFHFLPVQRIAHVHAKDCDLSAHTPEWTALGDGNVDWKRQMAALVHGGYSGDINLETHWTGPHGDKLEASRICALKLRRLAAAA